MPERKLCPDCGSNVGRGATKCRCGWKASDTEPEQVVLPTCANDGRPAFGTLTEDRKTTWVCEQCYLQHHIARLATPATEASKQRALNRQRILENMAGKVMT